MSTEEERCNNHWNSCDKIRFYRREDAYEYAGYLLKKRGYYMRVYWDGDCKCYHLTSNF